MLSCTSPRGKMTRTSTTVRTRGRFGCGRTRAPSQHRAFLQPRRQGLDSVRATRGTGRERPRKVGESRARGGQVAVKRVSPVSTPPVAPAFLPAGQQRVQRHFVSWACVCPHVEGFCDEAGFEKLAASLAQRRRVQTKIPRQRDSGTIRRLLATSAARRTPRQTFALPSSAWGSRQSFVSSVVSACGRFLCCGRVTCGPAVFGTGSRRETQVGAS